MNTRPLEPADNNKKRARILIVDDHPLIREGLSAQISAQPDMTVLAQAADGHEAMAALDRSQADVAIVDLHLRGRLGLELIKTIRTRFPDTRVLVVTAYVESLFAERALIAGAQGYVNKQHGSADILEAIRSILKGKLYVSAETSQLLTRTNIRAGSGGISSLTNRELEVFQLIGQGKSTSNIARQLHLSVHTIDSHRENIRRKLNVKSSAELTQRAVQWVLENR